MHKPSIRGSAAFTPSLSLAVGLMMFCPVLATAQLGSDTGVRYPGWVPADSVQPSVEDQADYDSQQSLWRYSYRVANAVSARQAILTLDLHYTGDTQSVGEPVAWASLIFRPPSARAGVSWLAEQPDDYGDSFSGQPAAAQIAPGSSLSGFALSSGDAPGYARLYVQGYARIPLPPDTFDIEDANFPDDTLNAQRRWVLGPTRYTTVITGGNRRPGVDGLLGFMNLATSGSVTIDPTPIALKFALDGATVYRETFRATLNGVDVTAAFRPAGPQSGADLVAVFHTGSSPLVIGRNVLLTYVDGLKPGTTQRATDADRIVFRVDGAADGFQLITGSLNNLPLPEPGEPISPEP